MRKCLFSLPFAAPAATFAFMYLNMGEHMSESGGTPLNPDDEESLNKRADGTCWEPIFRTHFWLDKRLAN